MSFPESYCEKMRPNQLKIPRSADKQQITSMPAANSDYGELVWENGQIVIKGGQSREVSRFPNKGSFINSKTGKSGSRFGFDEVVAGGEADSDMLSWFYHLDDTLPHESTSGFSAEIFGVTSDVLPVSHSVNKLSNPVKGSASFALDSKTELSDSLSLTYSGSEVSSVAGKGVAKYALQSDSLGDQLSELRLYKKQDREAGCPLGGRRSYSHAKNFPHFSRSAARSKNNLISDGARASGRFVTRETAAATEEMLVDTNDQTIDVMTKDLPGRPVERPASAFRAEGGLKVNQVSGNAQMERMDADMNKKPAAAAAALPSLCSDNGGVTRLKRKHRDEEDWEDSSEDAEEESAIIKEVGSKRSRPTEVHNLTERKRRGKINEKMRALQDLIPYCNKVDKAAMLDEAIEYLRVLQLQVQMMSMRAQMCALPMMAQPGLQHPYTTAPSSQFLPLGMGYQAGALDMTTGFPAQAACFPGQFKPPPIFWNAAQGLPTSMPGLLVPMPGAPPTPAPGSADETPNSKDPLHEEAV